MGHATPQKNYLLHPDEFIAGTGATWLIDGIVPASALVIMYAAPAAFKSFIALGMARAVITGQPFCGFEVPKSGSAVYMCLEGRGGARKRVEAVLDGVSSDERQRLGVLGPSLRMPETSVSEWPFFVQSLVEFNQAQGDIRLIVIDTLARFSDANENSASEMSKLLQVVQELIERFYCTVLIIHHSGKDGSKGGRGSSALEGAADTTIQVKRQDKSLFVQLICHKQKDFDEFDPVDIELEQVAIGAHSTLRVKGRADPFEAAFAATAADVKKPKLSAAKSAVLETLRNSRSEMRHKDLIEALKAVASKRTLEKALKQLKAAGEVETTADGLWRIKTG